MGIIDSMRMGMKVFDVPPGYDYLLIKEVDGVTRIWGAYCTYYRWEWDIKHMYPNKDTIVLFNGIAGGKIKAQICYRNDRVNSYCNKYIKNGYRRLKGPEEINNYPEVHDSVSKLMLWYTLRK